MALFVPLLIFLSGVTGLIPAAVLALLVVSGLLLVFLSQATSWQKSRGRVGPLLVIFLGFFSVGLLTPWSGLMLTTGGLLLVGVLMLVYARRPPAPEQEPSPPVEEDPDPIRSQPQDDVGAEPEPAEAPDETIPEVIPTPSSEEIAVPPAGLYCPRCACGLAEDFRFCPACGHDTNELSRCASCGVRQFIPAEIETAHCLHCGQILERASTRSTMAGGSND